MYHLSGMITLLTFLQFNCIRVLYDPLNWPMIHQSSLMAEACFIFRYFILPSTLAEVNSYVWQLKSKIR